MKIIDADLIELQIEDLMFDLDQIDLSEIEDELLELDSAISAAIVTNWFFQKCLQLSILLLLSVHQPVLSLC